MRNLAMQTTLLLSMIAISYPTHAAEVNLTACPSDKTVIGGVSACGKVWKLGSGDATLSPDGKLVVDLHGLVLNDASVGQFNGTPDGVDAVALAGRMRWDRRGTNRAGGAQQDRRCPYCNYGDFTEVLHVADDFGARKV
jgi:hypothetical protein